MFKNKKFWQDTAERAIKTLAQSLVAFLTANATGVLDIDWKNALSVSAFAMLLSVLTSIGSGKVGEDTASLIKYEEQDNELK